jgi:hypothetical protein
VFSSFLGAALLIGSGAAPTCVHPMDARSFIPMAAWSFNRCPVDGNQLSDGSGQVFDNHRPDHLSKNGLQCASSIQRQGKFGDAVWHQANTQAGVSLNQVPLDSTFTLSAWVYPSTERGKLVILAGGDSAGYELAYDTVPNSSLNAFRFRYGASSITSRSVPLGTWRHVAAVAEVDSAACPGAGQVRLRIYVDGGWGTTDTVCATASDMPYQVTVGGGPRSGRIDEVTLYKAAFDGEQVADLYGRPKDVYLGADTSAHPELWDGSGCHFPKYSSDQPNLLIYDFYLGRLSDGPNKCDVLNRSGYDILTGEPKNVDVSCTAFEMFAAAVARPQRAYGYAFLRGPDDLRKGSLSNRDFGRSQATTLIEQRERYIHIAFGKTLFADIESAVLGGSISTAGWKTGCASNPGDCTGNIEVLSGFFDQVTEQGFIPGVYTTQDVWNQAFGSQLPTRDFVVWLTGWNTTSDGSGMPGGAGLDTPSLREMERQTLGSRGGVLWQYSINPADYDATRQDPTVRFVPRSASAVDTVLTIDSSGSMSSTDPNRNRVAAGQTYITSAPGNDYIGVVDFDSNAELPAPLQVVDGNRDALNSAVASIDQAGGTNIGAGLGLACTALTGTGTPNSVRAAILLTDGEGAFSGEDECFRSRGWPVYTFGFGDLSEGAKNLLQRIADNTNGEFLFTTPVRTLCEFQRVRSKISGEPPEPCRLYHINPFQTIPVLAAVPAGQARVTFSTAWGGSDVIATLVTPSGRLIDRSTIEPGLDHLKGRTFEVYAIANPEGGNWEVRLYGADIPLGGEEVTFVSTTVPSAGEATDIPGLIRELNAACLRGDVAPDGVCRSLAAKLEAAKRALDREQTRAALNELRALLNELDAQRGRHVSQTVYQRMKAGLEVIIGRLERTLRQ